MLTYTIVATRVTKTTATCLDLIFVQSNNQTTIAPSVHEFGFSDHRGILLPIITQIISLKYFPIDNRTYSKKNTVEFRNEIKNVKWTEDIIKPNKSINEKYDEFAKIIKQIKKNQNFIKTKGYLAY